MRVLFAAKYCSAFFMWTHNRSADFMIYYSKIWYEVNANIFYFYLMNIQNAILNKQYPNNIVNLFVIFHELFYLKNETGKDLLL